MKKSILKLGFALSAAVPIATIVACGNSVKSTPKNVLLKTPNASDISDIKADVDGFTLSGGKAPANTTLESIENISTAGAVKTKVTLKATKGYEFTGKKRNIWTTWSSS